MLYVYLAPWVQEKLYFISLCTAVMTVRIYLMWLDYTEPQCLGSVLRELLPGYFLQSTLSWSLGKLCSVMVGYIMYLSFTPSPLRFCFGFFDKSFCTWILNILLFVLFVTHTYFSQKDKLKHFVRVHYIQIMSAICFCNRWSFSHDCTKQSNTSIFYCQKTLCAGAETDSIFSKRLFQANISVFKSSGTPSIIFQEVNKWTRTWLHDTR